VKTSLTNRSLRPVVSRLAKANRAFARRYPGESGRRQPVHTVYGGAHLFHADAASKLGAAAMRVLEEYAPDAAALAAAVELPARLATSVYTRVVEKLRREPVEDFRADFEDGYGNRSDKEEDGHAHQVAMEMASGMTLGSLPPFIGIRIKPFSEELRDRSIRTLDMVVTTLARETPGKLPANFVVTLPKVTMPEQVAALVDVLAQLERALRLARGTLRMELMIETPQSILNDRGESNLPLLAAAGRGRVVAAHFGTYDYTASCNITAAYQHMMHPACDFAKHMMQVALAGTGLWLSDGATNIMPVPVHRAAKDGPRLTPAQREENRAAVHHAWKLHYDHVRHSLETAYYQGWDLHPAQLPTRYAAVFAFFLESLDAASARLKNFVEKTVRATLVGDIFDDAATGQGLLNYFLRAINCGAISEDEAQSLTGLTPAELHSGSFVKILKGRSA
jgi:citrate lyase beta subunit